MNPACQHSASVASRPRHTGIRQRSLAGRCRMGRATELVFVLATGMTFVLAPGAVRAQTLDWDILPGDGIIVVPGNGTWDTTTPNWNDGNLLTGGLLGDDLFTPGADVVFREALLGPYTVTIDNGGAAFAVGEFSVLSEADMTLGSTVAGDSVDATSVVIEDDADLTVIRGLTATTISNEGTITFGGVIDGTVTGAGGTPTNAGGIVMSGAAAEVTEDVTVGAASSFRNAIGGSLTLTGGIGTVTNALTVGDGISVQNGAVLAVNANTTVTGQTTVATGAAVTASATLTSAVANQGTVRLNAGGIVSGSVTGAGALRMLDATSQVTGNVSTGATSVYRNQIGGNLAVTGATGTVTDTLLVGGGIAVQNAATLVVNGDTTVTLQTDVASTATLTATATLAADVANLGTVRLNAGGVVDGALTGTGALLMLGADAEVTGNVSTGANSQFRNEIGGGLTVTAGTGTVTNALSVGAGIAVQGTGTLAVNADTTAVGQTDVALGATLSATATLASDVANLGTVRLNAGGVVDGAVTGTGALFMLGANAEVTGNVSTGANSQFRNEIGGGLTVTAGTGTVTNTLSVGAGIAVQNSAALVVNGDTTVVGQTDVAALAQLRVDALLDSDVVNTGTLVLLDDGILRGTVTSTSTATLNGGRIEGLLFVNDGTATVGGSVTATQEIQVADPAALTVLAARTLTAEDGVVSAGDLDVAGRLEGDVTVDATGTLDLTGVLDGTLDTANLTETSGPNARITGLATNTGTMSVTGALRADAGILNDAGGILDVAATVTGNVTNRDTATLGPGRIIGVVLTEAGGTTTIDGDLRVFDGSVAAPSSFLTVQDATSRVEVDAGVTLTGFLTARDGGTAAVDGTVVGGLAAETVGLTGGSLAVTGRVEGSITVDAGSDLVLAGMVSAGTLPGGATVAGRIENRGTAELSGTVTGTVATVDGGVTTLGGDLVVTGGMTVAGEAAGAPSTLTLTAAQTLTSDVDVGALGFASLAGRVDGDVDVEADGEAALTGIVDGTLDVAGVVTLDGTAAALAAVDAVSGAVDVSSGGLLTVTGNARLGAGVTNAGTLTVNPGVVLDSTAATIANAGRVNVSGTVDGAILGAGGVTMAPAGSAITGAVSVGADSQFANTIGGGLTVTGGNGTLAGVLSVGGTIAVTGGSLTLDSATEGARTTVGSDGTLVVSAALTSTIAGGGVESAGILRLTGGGSIVDTVTNTGDLRLEEGTITGAVANNAGATTVSGAVSVASGIAGAGDIEVTATGDLTSLTGVSSGGDMTVAGTVTGPVTAIATGTLALTGEIDGTLDARGVSTVGTASVTGLVTTTGTMTIGGLLTADLGVLNGVGGLLDLNGGISTGLTNVGTLRLAGGVGGALLNLGTATVDGTATTGAGVDNAGDLVVAAGARLTAVLDVVNRDTSTMILRGTVAADVTGEAGSTVILDGGTVEGDLVADGALVLNGVLTGTLRANGETDVTGDTRVDGVVTNAGEMAVGAVLQADAGLTNEATGTLTVGTGGQVDAVVTNGGAVVLAGGGTGALANAAGATVTVTGAATQTGALTNQGAVIVESGGALTFASGLLTSTGTTGIDGGGILMGGIAASNGTVTVATNGRVTGNVALTGGIADIDGRIGSLTLNGGEASLGTGGTIDGLALVSLGTLDIGGGSIGNLTIAADGIVAMTGDAMVAGDVSSTGRIEAATTGTDITLSVAGTFFNDGEIFNTLAGGDLRIVAATIQLGSQSMVSGNVVLSGAIVNGGILVFDQDAVLAGDLTTVAGSTTRVEADVDADGNDIFNGGAFAVSMGGVLSDVGTFSNTGTLTIAAGSTVGAGNTINRDGGTLVNDGTLSGTLTNVDGGTATTRGTVDGDVDNAGTLTASGTVTGTILNTETGVLTVAGDLASGAVTTAGDMTVSGGATLTVPSVAVTAGTLVNLGTIAGDLTATAGTTVTSSGILTGDATLAGASTLSGDIDGALTNTATGVMTVAGALAVDGRVTNAGTLSSVAGARLTATGGLTTTGTATLLGGLSGDLATAGTTIVGGGTLTGSVAMTGGALGFAGPMSVSGALSLTGGDASSADVLAVGTIVSVGAAATLDVAGLTAQSLAVGGTATVSGDTVTTADVSIVSTGVLGTQGLAAASLLVDGEVTATADTVVSGLVSVTQDGSLTTAGLFAGTLGVAGTLTAADDTVSSGAVTVFAGGTLGTVGLTGASLGVGGTVTASADTDVTGAVTVLAGGSLGTVGLTGSTLDIDGSVSALGDTEIGGTIAVGSGASLATLGLTGSDLTVDGTVQARAATVITGAVAVGPLGTLTATDLAAADLQVNGRVAASGSVDVSDDVVVATTGTLDALTLDAATLRLGGGLNEIGTVVTTGSTTVAAGAELTTDTITASDIVVAGSLTVDGTATGAVDNVGILTAGRVVGAIQNDIDATLTVTGDLVGDVANAGSADIGGDVAGAVDNDGTMTIAGGIGQNLSNSGIATVGGSVTGDVTNDDILSLAGDIGGALTNTGTATVGGAVLGDVTNVARLTLDGNVGGTLTNRAGSVLTLADGIAISGSFLGEADYTIAAGESLAARDVTQSAGLLTIGGTLAATPMLPGEVRAPLLSLNGAGSAFLQAGGLVGGDVVAGTRLGAEDGARIAGTLSGGGTVSLENDVVGDVLRVGALAGDGMVLSYDIDLSTGIGSGAARSDLIVSSGAVSGDFVLHFDLHSAGGQLSADTGDVLLIDGEAGSDYAAVLASGTILPSTARTVFTLSQIGDDGDLFLIDQINPAIGALAGNIALTQSLIGSLVNRPTSPFLVQLAGESEPVCGYGAWGRATGGQATATGSTADDRNTFGSAVDSNYAGLQFGGDFACFNGTRFGFDWLAVGGTLGYNTGSTSQPVFQLDPLGGGLTTAVDSITTSDFEQRYAGLYLTGSHSGYVGDLQLRQEATAFTFNNVGVGGVELGLTDREVDVDATTLSGSVSRSFPIGEGGWSVVPTAGFSFTRTDGSVLVFDDRSTLTFDDHTSQLAFAGATFSRTQVRPSGTAALNYFATGTYYADFSDDLTSTFRDIRDDKITTDLASTPLGDFSELSVGINYIQILDGDTGKQFSASARIDARGSDNLDGYGATAQIRWQW